LLLFFFCDVEVIGLYLRLLFGWQFLEAECDDEPDQGEKNCENVVAVATVLVLQNEACWYCENYELN
jgi:hypothetical protein